MWPRNQLTERLGIDCPIIQAPMASAGTPELAAAVSNAGGLGSLGLGTVPAERAAEEIEAFRTQSNRSLNTNFFCHEEPGGLDGVGRAMRERLAPWYQELGLGPVPEPSVPYGSFGEAQLELILRYRPAVVSFHFGLPKAEWLEAVKDTGAAVLCSATTVAEARALQAAGVDAIIAQGTEAGGHRGTFQGSDPTRQPGLFALLPQVTSAVSIPVIAAGGIVDGRTIAAALVLGANAVQIGTAFLRCPETGIPPEHRAALAQAGDEDSRVTKLLTGKPARGLRNRLLDQYRDLEEEALPYPAQLSLVAPLRRGSDAADAMALWAGQSAALTREMSAAGLLGTLVRETENCLRAVDV